MKPTLASALLLIVITLGACGGDEDEVTGAQPIPAAGPYAQTENESSGGVRRGASYDLTGAEWIKLEDLDRFKAAQAYVADHPDDCSLGDRTAAADPVRDYADTSAGTDYPLTSPMAELLAEGCAAALQSGTSDLAAP